jgi:Protein kinase domain.
MSPEQLKSETVDHRSDIFSFGAVLYEMFSAKQAFRGKSLAEMMIAILHEDPPHLWRRIRRFPQRSNVLFDGVWRTTSGTLSLGA